MNHFISALDVKKNYERAYQIKPERRNNLWCKIFSKTTIKIEIILDNLTKSQASEKEKEFIRLYGRKDLNTGTLCNMTDGGDGIWNCIRSEETKEKLRQQKIGDKNPMFGKIQSDITKLKKSIKLKGQKRTDETKKRQSLSSINSGQAKSVDVYKFETNEYIGRFYAISEACRILDIYNLNGKASMVAKGKRKQTGGYIFKYV
jgi:hypothetical protein